MAEQALRSFSSTPCIIEIIYSMQDPVRCLSPATPGWGLMCSGTECITVHAFLRHCVMERLLAKASHFDEILRIDKYWRP